MGDATSNVNGIRLKIILSYEVAPTHQRRSFLWHLAPCGKVASVGRMLKAVLHDLLPARRSRHAVRGMAVRLGDTELALQSSTDVLRDGDTLLVCKAQEAEGVEGVEGVEGMGRQNSSDECSSSSYSDVLSASEHDHTSDDSSAEDLDPQRFLLKRKRDVVESGVGVGKGAGDVTIVRKGEEATFTVQRGVDGVGRFTKVRVLGGVCAVTPQSPALVVKSEACQTEEVKSELHSDDSSSSTFPKLEYSAAAISGSQNKENAPDKTVHTDSLVRSLLGVVASLTQAVQDLREEVRSSRSSANRNTPVPPR